MTQMNQISVLIPLAVGVAVFALTIFVHAVPLAATVGIVRREKKLGHPGATLRSEFTIVALIILLALAAHLVEIGVWAAVFVACGEFHNLAFAYYHSAGNYTTLGYGDLIMSPKWRLLGPLEAADGILMFGVSTAMIFTLILRLTQARFMDLRN